MIFEFEALKLKSVNDLNPSTIKQIEKIVRHSNEYKSWLHYLKQNQGLRFTLEYPEDFIDNNLSLEMHHLITLWDIVEIVSFDMLTNLEESEYLLPLDIAREIIMLHLRDEILVLPLSITLHERLHSGLYDLSDEDYKKVHVGNSKVFLDKYEMFMTDKQKNHFEKVI